MMLTYLGSSDKGGDGTSVALVVALDEQSAHSFLASGQQSFDGNVYNLRLWDYAMTVQQLNALSCDAVGNVIDWDNSHWSIPSGSAQTDTSLSCSESAQPMRRHAHTQAQCCTSAGTSRAKRFSLFAIRGENCNQTLAKFFLHFDCGQ